MRNLNFELLAIAATGLLVVTGCGDDGGGPSADQDGAGEADGKGDGDVPGEDDGGPTPKDPCAALECGVGSDGLTECGTCADGLFCDDGDCKDPCAGKTCGLGADQETDCGTCQSPKVCSNQGQCIIPPEPLGAWCGITPQCTPTIPNPNNPTEQIQNDQFSACLNAQCEGKICLSSSTVILSGFLPSCSKPCFIAVDNVNNSTGAPGADGIEDANAPGSDCAGAVDGPNGSAWSCVNFGQPGQVNAFCVPGTSFKQCDADADCPEGEGCQLTSIGGTFNGRCMSLTVAGEWGASAGLSENCNDDPFGDEDVAYCASGICFGLGCVTYCSEDTDCDTTLLDEDSGCDLGTGTCKGWPSRTCTVDLDCSGWICGEPRQIFSNVPEYTPALCWPRDCGLDTDCAGGAYCQQFWNGELGEEAAWEYLCLAGEEGGAPIGAACDENPDDNVPGDLCLGDSCDDGFCSGLCEADTDCGSEQVCGVVEPVGDIDEDGVLDVVLPLQVCMSFPGHTTECLVEADCAEGESCRLYEIENLVPDPEDPEGVAMIADPDAPFLIRGLCTADQEDRGDWGDTCGTAPGSEFLGCNSGFCLNTSPAICTHFCTSAADCPDIKNGEQVTKGFCIPALFAYGGDFDDPTNDLRPGVCLALGPEDSGEDCAGDFACEDPSEACSPLVISASPDVPAVVDYRCLDAANTDGSLPTKKAGDKCNPDAEDPSGNPIGECATALCLDDPEDEGVGYCSKLCDPEAADACPAGLACLDATLVERKGKYAENSASIWLCQKDVDCNQCGSSADCPGERSCVNLGQDSDTLEDWRCVPSCETDDQCAAEGAKCQESEDMAGTATKGCFEKDEESGFPVNFCALKE